MPSFAVEAPDLSGLIELSRDPHLDLKPVVLRVQTDLFLAAPVWDRAVLEAFGSLATGLIPTVDEETALIVARKLAPCAATPHTVLVRLAERGGEVCEALLASAAELPDTVVAAARASGLDVDAILAARAGDRVDIPVESAVALPEPARRDEAAAPSIAEARLDPERARMALARTDCGPADLAPLWLHAETHQRAAIRDAVEATAALRHSPPAPRDLAPLLSDCSTRRDVAGFVAALSASLGVPKDFLAAAPDSASRYDLLTLALRAADLAEPEAIYIFLTLNETVARSVPRVFELANLYRTTSRAAARDLLSAIIDFTIPERVNAGEHQSYLGADAKPRFSAATERALSRAVSPQRIRRSM